jgi:nucleoside-diphosphate-sugar epimerase
MRVLVTGHDGYIGSVLTGLLASEGHQVVGLDTYYFEGCSFGKYQELTNCIRKDLRDVTVADLDGFDAVCHLAALSNDPLGDLRPELTHDINHAGSLRLAALAKEAGCRRFVFSSSCSMYGSSGNEKPLAEDAPFKPLTPYAVSKVRLERDLAALADDRFSPTYMRNCTAYGAAPKLRGDIVLNNLTAWAYTTGKVRILSDGTPWRPLVHVEDICRAFIAVLHAPRELIHDQAFNIGRDEENYQVRDVAEIVQRVVPNCEIEYAEDAGPDPRSYRVDFGKLTRTFPKLRMQWDAEKGARELYEAFCENGFTRQQVDGQRYIRLNRLKHLIGDGQLDDALRWKEQGAPPVVGVADGCVQQNSMVTR